MNGLFLSCFSVWCVLARVPAVLPITADSEAPLPKSKFAADDLSDADETTSHIFLDEDGWAGSHHR